MGVRPFSETIPEAKSVLAASGYALVIEHIEAERDRYREWLIRLQRAANEVRGFWGIEGEDGYDEAIGDLAAVLDGLREALIAELRD